MAKCISCGEENPAGQKFCSECGMRLPAESTGGEQSVSATMSGAGAEQVASYKAEAESILKSGPVNLMSKRKLKQLQKQFGLTDDQAKDVEAELLADIERMKFEEQRRAAEEQASADSESYSVVLKVAAENKGPMLRDLVSITGKRLWPDISEMVENLPAVVVSGLDEDEASKYALALILDGAEAAVVADGSKIVEEEEGVDEEIDEENVEEISDDEPSPSARCSILLKSVGSDRNAVIRGMRLLFNCTFGEGKSIVEKAPVHLQQDIAREEAERIAAILRKAGATIELVDC